MSDSDPNCPPSAAYGRAVLGDGRSVRLASPFSRLSARIIDTTIVVLLTMVVVGAFSNWRGDHDGPFADDLCSIGLEANPVWHVWWCPAQIQETAPSAHDGDAPADPAEVDEASTTPRAHADDDSDPTAAVEREQEITETELWLMLAAATLYELPCLLFGRRSSSLGRYLLGIEVKRAENGQKLRWRQALPRWIIFGTAFAVLIVLRESPSAFQAIAVTAASGGTILLSPTRQGWHDATAETVVVQRDADDVWWWRR